MKSQILVITAAFVLLVSAACSNNSGDGGGGALTIMYVSPSGNDSNPGTQAEPKLTIQSAIARAVPPAEIHVAEGTYEITGQITMKNGVSIMGGYSLDFNERDPALHTTTITDTRTPSSGIIYAIYSAGISSSVSIDGFTINCGNAVSNGISFCIYNTASSPKIENNIVNGGTGDPSACVYNVSSSPAITGNTLNGAGGEWLSYGIYDQFSSNPLIANNIIDGGAGRYSHGIFNEESSSPTIANNTISGGRGTSYPVGILSSGNSRPSITNNIIYTQGAGIRYCIREAHVSGAHSDPASVRNNAFFDCPNALYLDEDSISITAANFSSQPVSTGEGSQTLSYWGSINEGGTGMFVNFGAGGMHLLNTAPLNIRGGGLAVSGVGADKDGIARTISTPIGMTNSGAAGWSMGAYENDN